VLLLLCRSSSCRDWEMREPSTAVHCRQRVIRWVTVIHYSACAVRSYYTGCASTQRLQCLDESCVSPCARTTTTLLPRKTHSLCQLTCSVFSNTINLLTYFIALVVFSSSVPPQAFSLKPLDIARLFDDSTSVAT
jgi:hypothetical protein